MDFDLIVIGGGAAGLGAARTARRRGASVLMISEGPLGGDCTWTGCVPSKTLIEAAHAGLPFAEAMRRVQSAIETIAATEDADSLAAEGIETRQGRAAFTRLGRVAVDGEEVSAKGVVIATGASPAVPPIPGLSEAGVHTNETVFDLPAKPESMVVLGGGAIGCELAQAFARLDVQVTVVEAAPRLLPREEPEASAVIEEVFEREGIDVRTGVTADKVEPGIAVSRLHLSDGSTVDAECILASLGRRPVTDGLDLEEPGVAVDERGDIVVDDRLATTAKGVWAAGDVTGMMPFTHAAFEQGRIAADNALGSRKRYRPEATPWVTFTDPEVARVGITEADAVERDGRVAYLPMSEMDRAIAAGATDGFVKLIAGPRLGLGHRGGGKVLGATIVASRAGEMIQMPALAMATGMFTGRLAQATAAYPTWTYGVQMAAAQFFMEIGGRTAREART
ncbi:FAD-dependent oxidoreductase [Glycomyces sp. L485]|uniref:dihydrolipoyl dehydrogenase family protein n=1 Tax=Glycomyces sp. L485 TaxID=2909235 RepID=UPI001F4ADC1A|nr:FAD-dependent oxidoreductase [Glycomyces sp. L485]MCH7230916.1 FAD-dependent oxidoreductase [Glycomyces sp. L485]